MNKRHVVIIGLNYQPQRSTGDKNFWVELIPLLAEKLDQISVISVRKHHSETEEFHAGNCLIKVKYLTPSFLETPDANYARPRIFWRKGGFPSWLGVLEKRMNVQRIIDELDNIYAEEPFSNIHLIDNFGLGNRIIAKKGEELNAATSVSAMAYQGKNPWIYHPYLKFSYNDHRLVIVPYSIAFRDKLQAIGKNPLQMTHIRWGVNVPQSEEAGSNQNALKVALGLPADKPLFLWAGYIQQILKNDFLFAQKMAREALNNGLKAVFYFAFKPEAFEKSFADFHDPKLGIFISSTTVEEFKKLKEAANVFYSPVINKRCILAPPLTWIELMGRGVPILTTNVPGATEIVVNGQTGYIAENENDLVAKMSVIGDNYTSMKDACLDKVKNDYNLNKTAEKYLNLWFKQE